MNSLICIAAVLAGVWASWLGAGATTPPILGDFNDDGQVTLQDFNMFRGKFGTTDLLFDLDGNGYVGLGDWNIFRSNFGKYSNELYD